MPAAAGDCPTRMHMNKGVRRPFGLRALRSLYFNGLRCRSVPGRLPEKFGFILTLFSVPAYLYAADKLPSAALFLKKPTG